MLSSALRLLSVVFLGAVATSASAGLMQYRTQVQASYGSGTSTRIEAAGGLLETSSSISLVSPFGNASSEASSSLSGNGYIPTLRATAVAGSTRAQAVAWGVQGFSNMSSESLSTTLLMNLTAEVTGGNDVSASVYLFQDENFEFYTDRGTMLFESTSMLWPGFKEFTNNLGPTGFDVQKRDITGSVNESRSFDFTVDPGDSFYIWAQLVATADQTGEVNAFNTLTASLTNIEGLQPAASDSNSVVPEPAGLTYFFVAAIGLLAGCARRSKKLKRAMIARPA